MDKPTKKGKKQVKKKTKVVPAAAALKVVYITNPIKFNATASEFRALVQELTGRDADVDSSRFTAAAAEEEPKVAAVEGNAAHAVEEEELDGLVASTFWHEDVHLDVFKSLGAI